MTSVAVSDVALPRGTASEAVDGPHARARRTRARLAQGVTLRAVDVGSVVAEDVRNAWFARRTPPSLAELWASRIPAKGKVPGGAETPASWVPWVLWIGFNHVTLPLSAVGYVVLWLAQHPVRALAAGLPVSALLLIGYLAASPHPYR